MIQETHKAAVEEKNEEFHYPTIDEYVERMERKEAENRELSRNEKYLMNLMGVKTTKIDLKESSNKDTKPPDIEPPPTKECCFSIGVIGNQKEEVPEKEEPKRGDKTKKVKNKKKSPLNKRPLSEEELKIKREWNRSVKKSLRTWKMKLVQRCILKNPP